MRTTSALIFEYGTNISGFCAAAALRTRARRSAIGSVTVLMNLDRFGCGRLLCPVAERHPHFAQKRFCFVVRPRGGHDGNIKSYVALDFIELDLRKNCLIGNPQGVVTMAIKTL